MSGSYFYPIKREFLNLSGGTVTGNTIFTQGVSITSISGDTLYSGTTDVEEIIRNISGDISGEFLSISGGTGGPYDFTGSTSAQTLVLSVIVEPFVDNTVDIGTTVKRFRSLNTVSGIAVNFTVSNKIVTPIISATTIELGTKTISENNIFLDGQFISGGTW